MVSTVIIRLADCGKVSVTIVFGARFRLPRVRVRVLMPARNRVQSRCRLVLSMVTVLGAARV